MTDPESEPPAQTAEEAGISFRPMADDDVDEVVAMLQAAFPRWPGIDVPVDAAAHLRWKVSSHPLSSETSTVMLKDGAIVAGVIQFARDVQIEARALGIADHVIRRSDTAAYVANNAAVEPKSLERLNLHTIFQSKIAKF